MRVEVFARSELAGDASAIERANGRLGYTGQRASEWLAGRVAARRVLGDDASVLCGDDGAPCVASRDTSISISHDGDWVAVATGAADRAVAVDVCRRVHAERAERILARLGVTAGDPCVAWAMLECALKLHKLGVWELLATRPVIDGDRVSGVGDRPVRVGWRANPDYVLAWAEAA